MFKEKVIFLGFLLMVQFSLRCQGYSYLQPVKFGEGECFDDDWDVHPIGSVWYDKAKCEKLACVLHAGILYIKGYGCSSIGRSKDCWLVPGSGGNYPRCCPRVECSDGETFP